MSNLAATYALIYQVLDRVVGAEAVTTGCRGAVYSASDDLRSSAGDIHDLRRAEKISVEIHKLDWALQRRDVVVVHGARAELKALAVDWLNARIGCGGTPLVNAMLTGEPAF